MLLKSRSTTISSVVSVHPNEVEVVLMRVWSSAVASSLQMSAPQKALDQPSQAWLKTPPSINSARYTQRIIQTVVDINTGQVMFYLLRDYDNNTE